MNPHVPTGKRHDLGWRRGDLAVLIVLTLVSGVLLAGRAGGRSGALDPVLRGAGPRADEAIERIDPNVASAHSLRRLPGIGPVLADAIVEARQAGPFANVEDLRLRVRGIGPVTAEIIAPFLSFGDPGR